jgi:hypothetical protein
MLTRPMLTPLCVPWYFSCMASSALSCRPWAEMPKCFGMLKYETKDINVLVVFNLLLSKLLTEITNTEKFVFNLLLAFENLSLLLCRSY